MAQTVGCEDVPAQDCLIDEQYGVYGIAHRRAWLSCHLISPDDTPPNLTREVGSALAGLTLDPQT
jgi:hypothetical protein